MPSVASNSWTNTTLPESSGRTTTASVVENFLAEGRMKVEKDKKDGISADKEEQQAKAEACKAAMILDAESVPARRSTYAQQQRQRQQEATHERDRIRRQIEQDKIERREKYERRKELAEAESWASDPTSNNQSAEGEVSDSMALTQPSTVVDQIFKPQRCSLKIRLLDGSTLRRTFASSHSIRTHVRPWIDEERPDGETPYFFKQVLTPLPIRTISIAEEERTLQDLGMSPTSILIMAPVQRYTDAFSENHGTLTRGVTAGLNIVSAGAGIITGALGTFLGFDRRSAEQPSQDTHRRQARSGDTERLPRATSSSIFIRTLHGERGERNDHQLYNGNQVRMLHSPGPPLLIAIDQCRATPRRRSEI